MIEYIVGILVGLMIVGNIWVWYHHNQSYKRGLEEGYRRGVEDMKEWRYEGW